RITRVVRTCRHRTSDPSNCSKSITLTCQGIAQKTTIRHASTINSILIDSVLSRNRINQRIYKPNIIDTAWNFIAIVQKRDSNKRGTVRMNYNEVRRIGNGSEVTVLGEITTTRTSSM